MFNKCFIKKVYWSRNVNTAAKISWLSSPSASVWCNPSSSVLCSRGPSDRTFIWVHVMRGDTLHLLSLSLSPSLSLLLSPAALSLCFTLSPLLLLLNSYFLDFHSSPQGFRGCAEEHLVLIKKKQVEWSEVSGKRRQRQVRRGGVSVSSPPA